MTALLKYLEGHGIVLLKPVRLHESAESEGYFINGHREVEGHRHEALARSSRAKVT